MMLSSVFSYYLTLLISSSIASQLFYLQIILCYSFLYVVSGYSCDLRVLTILSVRDSLAHFMVEHHVVVKHNVVMGHDFVSRIQLR